MPSTAQEQYVLELLNDARMDPLGDAARYLSSYAPLTARQQDVQTALDYFGVSGGQLLAAYRALAPVQPLAFSDVLEGGAVAHDNAMIAAGQQTHQAPGEADLGTRLSNEGYAYRSGAENVYAYADNLLYAQAGFMVDWGGSAATGGMQSPAGHRVNIMNAALREVGIGVAATSAGGLGPEVLTEDFGSRGTSGSFVLGVAYADADRDGFYSVGEGVAGLVVSVGGISVTTASSGGYTLATPLVGVQTVTLSGGGLANAVSVRTALTDGSGNGLNVKLDVIDGAILHLSGSATVSGGVSAVQLIGLQPSTLAEGDGIGRTLLGNDGGDTINAGPGNDVVTGGAGDDTIDGGAGSNVLDGGGGTNTVVFGFASTAATIAPAPAGWVVTSAGTVDTVSNFQAYRFTDRTLTTLTVTTHPAAIPLPDFDAAYYLAHNPDVAAAGVDPLLHYETFGWHEGRNPSALFDTAYYLQQNPDVAAARVDPLEHFESIGWTEGRQPSLLFDDAKYLAANPDVKAAGVEPLAHYLVSGHGEGRAVFLTGGTAADPLVDAAYYDRQLGATLIPAGVPGQLQAAWSYAATGWQKGLNPDALFDTSYYLSHNPDVAAAGVDPLWHYETSGWTEGRDPSAAFSTTKYLTANPDVKAAGLDPLVHYEVYGQGEGRAIYGV